MKKFIILLIAATCGLYYFYNQQSTVQKVDNILTVGTSADYPPYEKIDLTTGKIVGLDVDIVQEIAQRLGKEIKFIDMPFNSLILNLGAEQIDLVIAGLSASQDRKEAVLFSDVYLDNDHMVIVTKSGTPPLTSVQDLYGKKVAVNTGYNADTYLSTMPEISLIRLDSAADSALALQANNVDAFATSKSSYMMFINTQQDPSAYQYLTIPYSSENCAIAFAKTNSNLQQTVNAILNDMKKDGTLQNIKNAWGFHD